jgi:hypothetical protein
MAAGPLEPVRRRCRGGKPGAILGSRCSWVPGGYRFVDDDRISYDEWLGGTATAQAGRFPRRFEGQRAFPRAAPSSDAAVTQAVTADFRFPADCAMDQVMTSL